MPEDKGKPLNDHSNMTDREMIIEIRTITFTTKEAVEKQNGRIGKLEEFKWKIIGGLGVVTALAGWGLLK